MRISVTGQSTLAAAVRAGCTPYFEVVPLEANIDICWCCYDTPICNDTADVFWVLGEIAQDVAMVRPGTLILVSSQIPVGTIARLEQQHPMHTFAYSPENLRVKTALQDFLCQKRIIVGYRAERYLGRSTCKTLLDTLLSPFSDTLIYTTPETAEMAKHALNSYLALMIVFANEIAKLALVSGADSEVITRSLLSERRVGAEAPLHPGAPFGGGHLARDLTALNELAQNHHIPVPVLAHILESNGGEG